MEVISIYLPFAIASFLSLLVPYTKFCKAIAKRTSLLLSIRGTFETSVIISLVMPNSLAINAIPISDSSNREVNYFIIAILSNSICIYLKT